MSIEAISTYEDLKTILTDELLRAGDDTFAARLPRLIQQAEQQLERQLRVPELEAQASLTLTAATATIAQPADFLAPITLRISTDPGPIDKMDYEALEAIYGCQSAGKPRAFALYGATIAFGPVPDTAYTAVLRYHKRLPRLSTAANTNDVFGRYWDCYFYAACLAAAPGLGDDGRIATWTTLFSAALASANEQANAISLISAQVQARPRRVYGRTPPGG